jgi:hypothetical protein
MPLKKEFDFENGLYLETIVFSVSLASIIL